MSYCKIYSNLISLKNTAFSFNLSMSLRQSIHLKRQKEQDMMT